MNMETQALPEWISSVAFLAGLPVVALLLERNVKDAV